MRNFKTMTAPESRSTQFASLAVDKSGDVVAAGALDTYEIFIWMMRSGSLLNVSRYFSLVDFSSNTHWSSSWAVQLLKDKFLEQFLLPSDRSALSCFVLGL